MVKGLWRRWVIDCGNGLVHLDASGHIFLQFTTRHVDVDKEKVKC